MKTQHRVWVYGDHINTDVIFPGKYTYTLKAEAEIASKALEDIDPLFAREAQRGDVVVAGRNWGCGSSREQAVTALKYCGVTIIIAASFNGLYYRNCINQGVYPIICPDVNLLLKTGDNLAIDLESAMIDVNGRQFQFTLLPPTVQSILNAGGLVQHLQRRFKN
jgi:3-isopropylmalate/(R)-2-methylmalate dehydratase small subunit